jgi:FADH2 O2-dependent halogenase
VSRLAEIIEREWTSNRMSDRLHAYGEKTDAELVAASCLIGALYANMSDFAVFTALSLLYFAAVSFSEAARRLGKPELASSFLLHDDAVFGPASRQLLERAQELRTKEESTELVQDILRTIEPFNVAGFGDAARRNWYPVNADDLLRSAHKLDTTAEDILQMLQRCGFAATGIPSAFTTSQ